MSDLSAEQIEELRQAVVRNTDVGGRLQFLMVLLLLLNLLTLLFGWRL